MTRRSFLAGAVAMAIEEDKLAEAVAAIEAATRSGDVWSAALYVRQGEFTLSRGFGRSPAPDAVYLLASITKPMTATAVMTLVEGGAVSLTDRVDKFIPEFRGGDRALVTVRHLLTHTSGLPDMLPENTELRKRHAPLKDFVAGVCKTPLLFKPGTQVRYQSMGILLAAEIVERVTHQPLRDYLKKEVFAPLGMEKTSLGLGGRRISDTVLCQVPEHTDWDWNSPYWRDLGAPWGGAHSTAPEVARFLDLFLKPGGRVLRPETARQMVTNQTPGLNTPWGIGWMVKPGNFGKACSAATFGHYGATGTVAWADPKSGTECVLLTTKPAAQSRDGLLGPVSDAVSRAAQG
jgi:beta-lactamase class C